MEQVFTRIESYLDGQMADAEREAFEADLTTDATLSPDLAFYLHAREALGEAAYEQRKAELLALLPEADEMPTTGGRAFSLRSVWGIGLAASLALLIGLGYWAFTANEDITFRQMAEGFTTQKMSGVTTMGNGGTSLQSSLDRFNEGRFGEARDGFLLYLQQSPNDPVALEGAARAHTALGEYRLALNQLAVLENLGGPYNSAKFYTALVFLRRNASGDLPKARAILETLVGNKGGRYKESQQLLEKM